MLLKSKELIADYATEYLGDGNTNYTTDNVELPDAYILYDTQNKILYDCSLEARGIAESVIPVYLASRNITENSIVFADNLECILPSRTTSINTFISRLSEDTINKISFNIDDYIMFNAPLI